MGLNLLEKTELWVNELTLEGANLTDVAVAAADVLDLPREEVLVVDVRPRHITLDILSQDIPLENITGKQEALLEALGALPGVHVTPETHIHSNGILGMICLEDVDPRQLSERVDGMVDEMRRKIARRAMVFPTGFEVSQGLIEDTNTPYLQQLLEQRGYSVSVGPIVEDSVADVEGKLGDALSRAFGLLITTGGVGAEDKDKTVEGILRLDPAAATPYIVKFQQGTGRHVKDGVRIAVGQVGPTWIAALPGPNDEVRVGAQVLLDCLDKGYSKEACASKLAEALAGKLAEKQKHWRHHHKHQSTEDMQEIKG